MSFELPSGILNNFLKENKCKSFLVVKNEKTVELGDKKDWVICEDPNFENINLLDSLTKNGIMFLTKNIKLKEKKDFMENIKYIYDEEYSSRFTNEFKVPEEFKIMIFRKFYLYPQDNYKLALVRNKPENLNENIDWLPDIKKIGNYLNYRDYFKNAKSKSIMLDIGANMGLSSCPVLSKGHIVYCFEPEKINLEMLKQIKKNNNFENMHIEDKVVCDYDGEISFFSNINREDNSSISRACSGGNVCPTGIIEKKYPCIKLDTWYEKNKENVKLEDVQLIKIDTQGAEFDILKGGRQLLSLCSTHKKCMIEIECDHGFMSKREITFEEISDYLDTVGFKLKSKGYDSVFIPK